MAIEGYCPAINTYVLVALDDHTVLMPRPRTGALVADAGDCTAHDGGLILTCHNASTMAGCVAYSNDPSHHLPPKSTSPYRTAE